MIFYVFCAILLLQFYLSKKPQNDAFKLKFNQLTSIFARLFNLFLLKINIANKIKVNNIVQASAKEKVHQTPSIPNTIGKVLMPINIHIIPLLAAIKTELNAPPIAVKKPELTILNPIIKKATE